MALAELDYVLVSYVCIYVAKQRGDPVHEATCDEWQRLLKGGVRAMLVSERSEETAACGMMEARGVSVERLIEQSLGKDERQPGVSCRECHSLAPWLIAHALGCGTHSGRAAVTTEPRRASMGGPAKVAEPAASPHAGRASSSRKVRPSPRRAPRALPTIRSSPSPTCPSKSTSSSAAARRALAAARPGGTREPARRAGDAEVACSMPGARARYSSARCCVNRCARVCA